MPQKANFSTNTELPTPINPLRYEMVLLGSRSLPETTNRLMKKMKNTQSSTAVSRTGILRYNKTMQHLQRLASKDYALLAQKPLAIPPKSRLFDTNTTPEHDPKNRTLK